MSSSSKPGRTSPHIAHPLRSGTTPSAPGISLRFLPTVMWKKGKTEKVQGLGAQPRGSMRWDTDGQRGFCLSSPRPSHLLAPGCKSREGQEPAQDPGAASQDLAEPRAASLNVAAADEHRRERKHCQVIREKALTSIPASPLTLPHLTLISYLAHASSYPRELTIESVSESKSERENEISVLSTKQNVLCLFGDTHENRDRKTNC